MAGKKGYKFTKEQKDNVQSQEIDVVGKPMIPSAPKTSGNVNSVTPDNVQGCGKFVKFWNRNCGQIEDLKHGYIILCDDCKKKGAKA